MKSKIKSFSLVVCLLALGFLFVHVFFWDTNTLLFDNEFLITFVGVVLGISTTITTFIFSSTEKIREVIFSTRVEENAEKDAEEVYQKFKKGYTELVEDNSFIFLVFILLIICVACYAIDVPYITCPVFISKDRLLDSIKMGLSLNCVLAIGDLFLSLSAILKLAVYEK